jgi:hypothetical protein
MSSDGTWLVWLLLISGGQFGCNLSPPRLRHGPPQKTDSIPGNVLFYVFVSKLQNIAHYTESLGDLHACLLAGA